MILTRSTRLSQPTDAAGVDSRFGGRNDWLIAPGSPGSLPISGVVPTITDQYGSSHYFDGASLQVLGNDANVNATGGQFTLLAYAKFDGTSGDRGVVGNRATTGANAYAQIVHRSSSTNRRIVFTYKGTSAEAEVSILSAGQSIPPGSTQLVAMVVNGTSVRCYVGAEFVGSGVSTAPVPSGHLPYLRAGNYFDNSSSRRFRGGIYYAGLLPVALSGEDIAALARNPWQLFRPIQRRIYFDVGSIAPPSDHTLTAESVIQQILSEAGSVAQENTLVSGISVQSAVSSNGVIQQINTLIGENSFSNNLSAVAALTQLNILQGNNQQTTNLSSNSSVSQIHSLSALSTAVEIASSSAGILQSNLLLGSSCLVPNYSTSGSIALVPVIDLSGNSVSQHDLSSSSSLLQDHVLAQNASEQPVLSSSGAVVQTHVLVADNSTQIVLSSSGAIGTSGGLLGNNAQQTNASSAGFIIQASFLQGNVVKQLNLSSSGAITQGGELPPLTDAEIRQMFAMLQVAVAKLQTRVDAVL